MSVGKVWVGNRKNFVFGEGNKKALQVLSCSAVCG